MDVSVSFVAQYVPVGGRLWTDLKEETSEENAALAIDVNIDGFSRMRHQECRPSRYRVVRREVSEAVLLEVADDRGVK
jgi:hypothetical protein